MALIRCPQCQNEISDRASKCPNCGYEMYMTGEFGSCEECGKPLKPNVSSCQNCGCPILPKENKKQNNNTAVRAAAVVLAIIVVAFVILAALISSSQRKAEYSEKILKTVNLMTDGVNKAEASAILIQNVWSNTIWERSDATTDKYTKNGKKFNSDFQDSLNALMSDADFIQKEQEICDNRDSVIALLGELKNPPGAYKDEYEAVTEFYNAYIEMVKLAVNPSGSLQTYTDELDAVQSALSDAYNNLKMYFKFE